uniref:DDE_Tnp_IS1595 domain-containing protein n=1 Tax=Trichuris muris TaxID=70415 RepID=A0A5S6QID9_TRIMR
MFRRNQVAPAEAGEMIARYMHDEAGAIAFMQEHGILHRDKRCECGNAMVLRPKTPSYYRWRCGMRTCGKDVALRSGTWLEGTYLPIRTALLFIHAWSLQKTACSYCEEYPGMNARAAVQWNLAMREVVAGWLLRNPVAVGGPGLTVEVDETLFSRRKYNRGRSLPQQWVLGGVCRETGHCFLAPVADRSAATLVSVVTANVAAGSTVITDEWRGYRGLSPAQYTHMRVNHSLNFVNPETGAHTQTIESLWTQLKYGNKIRRGTHRSMTDSYLWETEWRRRIQPGENPFDKILRAIAEDRPLQ